MDYSEPFQVDPIIPYQVMSAHDVHVKVVPIQGGQDVMAWLEGKPKHPLTGEDIQPTTRKLALPGDNKREAFHILHPETNAGVALAIHPESGEIIGWYSATVISHEDVELGDIELGVPPEWCD